MVATLMHGGSGMIQFFARRTERSRKRADSGFTLIELLVTIIILGVLSAVVVFAVRGAGDKGQSSAYAIDAKTIRTAQEAFCAKNGRYGSGQELVAGQFLSEVPTYHHTEAVAPTPDSSGNCPGSGDLSKASFYITCDATKPGCGGGGATRLAWQQQNSGSTTLSFEDVSFVDTQKGWAVARGGNIRNTTDGGTTWNLQTSGTALDLLEVDFVDATHGWAVGWAGTSHVIVATVDGGANWVQQTNYPAAPDVPTNSRFDGVDFIDVNRGWIGASDGLILATVDGGATWTVQHPLDTARDNIRTIRFLDSQYGWAGAGFGEVWHTDNGGASWALQAVPSGGATTGVKFANASKGWAVGVGTEKIHGSTNGGVTWTLMPTIGLGSNRTGIDSVNERRAWAVGLVSGGRGAVLRTEDGGATWQDQPIPNTGSVNGIDFVDAAHGWIVGTSGKIWRLGPVA